MKKHINIICLKKLFAVLLSLFMMLPLFGCSEARVETDYDENALFNFGLALASKNGKWGFIDKSGNEVIPFIYEYLSDFGPEGLAAACREINGVKKYAFIDIKGNVTGDKYFEKARGFVQGYAAVCVDGLWGFVDKNIEYHVEPRFSELSDYDANGYAEGSNVFTRTFIDIEGNYVEAPLSADGSVYFENDLTGLTNRYGTKLSEPIYERVSVRNANGKPVAYHIRKNGKTGIADILTGEIILEPIYDGVSGYFTENGMLPVSIDGEWGYVNRDGETLIDFKYSFANTFSEGFATVKVGKKWGYINEKGEYYVEPSFDEARDFCEGRAAVKLGSKWGFIDSKGYFIAEPQFDYVDNFKNGFAAISIDGKWGYIDLSGDVVIEPAFEAVGNFEEYGFAWIGENLGSGCLVYYANGVINNKGKVIFQPDKVTIDYYTDGYFVLKDFEDKDKAISVLYDAKGNMLFEFENIGTGKTEFSD